MSIRLQIESKGNVKPPDPRVKAAHVRALPRGAARRVSLDAAGVGEVRLPARATGMSAIFRIGAAETFRLGPLPLE